VGGAVGTAVGRAVGTVVGGGVGAAVATGVGMGVGAAVGVRVGIADAEGVTDTGGVVEAVGVFGVPTAATTMMGTQIPAITTDTSTLAIVDQLGRLVHRRYSPHGNTNTSMAIVHHGERYHGLSPEPPPVGRSPEGGGGGGGSCADTAGGGGGISAVIYLFAVPYRDTPRSPGCNPVERA
jgi:hypothetical protein